MSGEEDISGKLETASLRLATCCCEMCFTGIMAVWNCSLTTNFETWSNFFLPKHRYGKLGEPDIYYP